MVSEVLSADRLILSLNPFFSSCALVSLAASATFLRFVIGLRVVARGLLCEMKASIYATLRFEARVSRTGRVGARGGSIAGVDVLCVHCFLESRSGKRRLGAKRTGLGLKARWYHYPSGLRTKRYKGDVRWWLRGGSACSPDVEERLGGDKSRSH